MSETATRVITPEAVLSYPHLHQPQAPRDGNGKPKYSGTFIFTKEVLSTEEGKAKFLAMQKAAIEAATAKFGATYKLPNGQVIPIVQAIKENIIKSPFRADALAKGYPEGAIFINARTDARPGTVYGRASADGKTPETLPLEKVREELYAGAIVRASVTAFGYDNSGNKGVSFALNNVQKLRDSTRIDGRVQAENEFDADLSAAPVDISSLI